MSGQGERSPKASGGLAGRWGCSAQVTQAALSGRRSAGQPPAGSRGPGRHRPAGRAPRPAPRGPRPASVIGSPRLRRW